MLPGEQGESTRTQCRQVAALAARAGEVGAAWAHRHHPLHVGERQHTIHPGPAMPAWREPHPIGMIVEMQYREWLFDPLDQQYGEVVEIARPEEGHGRSRVGCRRDPGARGVD